MSNSEYIQVERDCEGHLIPSGDLIKLKKGSNVKITQSLGGDFTVYINGNLVKIAGKDADAIGQKVINSKNYIANKKFDEKHIWNVLKTCYDPEIPVNIVDLGLIYDLNYKKIKTDLYFVNVKMILTAPGCGMGPMLVDEVKSKVSGVSGVRDVIVELVWDPPWTQDMVSEAARLDLGMY